MTHAQNVRNVYGVFNAAWYDPFRSIWTKLVSENAEARLNILLKKSLKPSSSILELGCGTGVNIERLRKHRLPFRSYTGIDFSGHMLAIAKNKFRSIKEISFIKKDLNKKPSPKKYDMIISTWVLSHLDRPSGVINRYYNQLAKGGKMLLVFLVRPKPHIDIWFYPFVRLFAAKYVNDDEITMMKGKKSVKKYGITAFVEIRK